MRKTIGACLLWFACVASAGAADADGVWQAVGGIPCSTFVDDREANRDNAYQWWFLGWVAAHNRLLDDTYTLIPDEATFKSSIAWIETYCREYPRKTIADAALSLVDDRLRPNRIHKKP